MLDLQHILFPTDFSEHAERAFAYAAYMAVLFDAEVHVLNVTAPEGETAPQDPMAFLPLERRDRIEHLYFAADARENVPVRYEQVEHAAPATAILEHAGRVDADLIVMGTRGGRGGISRVMAGSVTEEVVRQARCPTLTIRTGEGPVPPRVVRHVLAPVDFSGHARLQLAHAKALADAYDAELDLLHVIDIDALPVVYGLDTVALPDTDVEKRAEEALRTMAEEAGLGEAHLHVARGYPAAVIEDFADEHEARLIVMATHGRTGLERFLIGSVAEKVVRTAGCPVFTVRAFGKSLVRPGAAA